MQAPVYDSEPCRNPPRLEARALSVAAGNAGCEVVLEDVSFTLAAGECIWIRGATGSGKTSLLRTLMGLRGCEPLDGRAIRHGRIALLLQNLDTQLICTTVEEEVAFGPRRGGLAERETEQRVARALAAVGLDAMRERGVDSLSVGERQRVLIAALLALEPSVLLLDEPTSGLDPAARRRLTALLGKLKAEGTALLIAEHDASSFHELIDRELGIDGRRLVSSQTDPDRWAMQVAAAPPAPASEAHRIAGLGAAAPALHPLYRGARVLVAGANGSGKSTWLRELADALARGATRRGPGGVALVIQEPQRQLFARTVEDELTFALRRRRFSAEEMQVRIDRLQTAFGLAGMGSRSPLRLSHGQQHRLAIAAALAPMPDLLLIDEPFAGLDPAAREALLDLLAGEQRARGMAIVLASHDTWPLAGWCHRTCSIDELRRSRG